MRRKFYYMRCHVSSEEGEGEFTFDLGAKEIEVASGQRKRRFFGTGISLLRGQEKHICSLVEGAGWLGRKSSIHERGPPG